MDMKVSLSSVFDGKSVNYFDMLTFPAGPIYQNIGNIRKEIFNLVAWGPDWNQYPVKVKPGADRPSESKCSSEWRRRNFSITV